MERFTEEQDEALQLLTYLQHLEFSLLREAAEPTGGAAQIDKPQDITDLLRLSIHPLAARGQPP